MEHQVFHLFKFRTFSVPLLLWVFQTIGLKTNRCSKGSSSTWNWTNLQYLEFVFITFYRFLQNPILIYRW